MKHSSAPPRRLNVAFDDGNLIANAGLLSAALLLDRLQVGELAEQRLTLANPAASPNRADKLSTLICSSLIGGDCIEDADALRAGGTARILGFRVKAPSTLRTFLRSFGWGNLRQLDAVGRAVLKNAWAMGAGPGARPLTIDVAGSQSTFDNLIYVLYLGAMASRLRHTPSWIAQKPEAQSPSSASKTAAYARLIGRRGCHCQRGSGGVLWLAPCRD